MIELAPNEVGPFLDRYQERLFRMELLPAYAVDSDGDDYHRWVAGAREPTWERKNAWLAVLRGEWSEGRTRSRVRVLSAELTEYERYACAWGYALNVEAGEDIRVLHRGEHPIPGGLIEEEFWVLDDDAVVHMHYDDAGRFLGATALDDATAHVIARDAAWSAAEPFTAWWTRHPELHRPVP